MTTVDEYLETVKPSQKVALERIRVIIKQTVPEVEESISYNMPTFKYKGNSLLLFSAFKNHMSIFGHLSNFEEELKDFKLSHKGTVQFTEKKPIPEKIIKEIILKRRAEIDKSH